MVNQNSLMKKRSCLRHCCFRIFVLEKGRNRITFKYDLLTFECNRNHYFASRNNSPRSHLKTLAPFCTKLRFKVHYFTLLHRFKWQNILWGLFLFGFCVCVCMHFGNKKRIVIIFTSNLNKSPGPLTEILSLTLSPGSFSSSLSYS